MLTTIYALRRLLVADRRLLIPSDPLQRSQLETTTDCRRGTENGEGVSRFQTTMRSRRLS